VQDIILRDKIIENIIESIKMRGDVSSTNEIKKTINKYLEMNN
jgi:hypothetical protein